MDRSLRIVIACGGTGGHLFPGIAVAEELRLRGHQPLLLISQKNVDREAAQKYGDLEFLTIPAIAKPSTRSWKMLPFLWKMLGSIRRCRAILRERRADAVLGMGGFTSLAPVYAAKKLGLRTFVHDSNALPGKANRLTARWCDEVLLGLKEAAAYFPQSQVEITGTPVRKEMSALPPREAAAQKFGLDPHRPVLAVMGGSQGAKKLNDLTVQAHAQFPLGTQVLHVAGTIDEARVRAAVGARADYQIIGFCDDMPSVYAVADAMLCRSGASSLTEIAHAGLASILVPYPYAADDHQTKNADVFAKAGAAILVQEADLDAAELARLVGDVLGNEETLRGMRQAARALDVADAAQRICERIEKSFAR
ncbi:MAG: undecaprenyldiphospho-muramoylpentapeptide beta-N-acetylglucosaminyltransferase [Verrucomicrobia bacterium]|nr:MAG: undecaprenyldiphospho-muramoylpentapeptide beta-N-acetylglucosaminyltransferase [Verrucomicrobiota bacterium]